jgi:RimJ/RimL family protein N-acetyltransferase
MPAVEIGWRLGRAFWGCGLATEAAAATLRFGLIDRHLGQIISIAQVGNGASERIMGKLGMRLVRETVGPTCDRPGRSTRSPGRSTWRQAQGQTATAGPGVT